VAGLTALAFTANGDEIDHHEHLRQRQLDLIFGALAEFERVVIWERVRISPHQKGPH